MYDNFEYTEQVAQAAATFDIIRPGWHNEVNTLTLDMQSNSNCVLAQLSGTRDAIRYWGEVGDEFGGNASLFCGGLRLRDAWIEQIEKRRAEDGSVVMHPFSDKARETMLKTLTT